MTRAESETSQVPSVWKVSWMDAQTVRLQVSIGINRPPPPCPTNTVSNKHFRSDRIFWGPN